MSYEESILIPIIVGINEVFKYLGVEDKYIPVISLLVGIAFGVFALSPADVGEGIINGLYLGLSSVGLYSGVKNVGEAVNFEE